MVSRIQQPLFNIHQYMRPDCNFTKLNLGCGIDIRYDYLNLDIASLPGVDVIYDLETIPYPFGDNMFEEILAIDVLEHLSNTIKVLEELWRISRSGARLIIRVPYWNSIDAITDPTHKKLFNEFTFEFFDPTRRRCQKRFYYSKARFLIDKECFCVYILGWGYAKTENRFIKKVLSSAAHFLCNVVRALEYHFIVIK